MTIEEFEKKVEIMKNCEMLKNHQFTISSLRNCTKCDIIDPNNWIVYLNLNTYASLIAFALSGKGIINIVKRIRKIEISYDDEKMVCEYLKKVIENVPQKIKEQLKILYAMSGGNTNTIIRGYEFLIAPSKHQVSRHTHVIGNREDPKWINELYDANFANSAGSMKKDVLAIRGVKKFLDILKYKLKNYGIAEAKSFSYFFRIDLNEIDFIPLDKELIPLMPPEYLLHHKELIEKYSKEILKIFWINVPSEAANGYLIIRLKQKLSDLNP